MALPDRVMDIIDCQMLSLEELDDYNDYNTKDKTNDYNKKDKTMECLISLVRLGVSCSTEKPNERMDINEILTGLNVIKLGLP